MAGGEGLQAFSVFGDVSLRGGDQVMGALSGMAGKAAAFFTSPMGLALAAVAAVIGVGVAATNAAGEIEGAVNIIRVGTGKTGVEMDKLKGSFEKVAGSTAATFDDSAKVITRFSAQLGLSGKPLEDLSTKTIKLARITKTDISGAAESAAKMWRNWNMTTDQSSASLDFLLSVSQRTGIGTDQLMSSVTKLGPNFRSMNMDFEHGAALLGQFSAAGIDTGKMGMALQGTLKKFAKEGVTDTGKAFADLINRIKTMPDSTAAAGLAISYFGRSGTAMSDAIRAGKVNVDELVNSIATAPGSVNKTATDVSTLSSKFGILTNNAKLAMEPLGMGILDALNGVTASIIPLVKDALPGLQKAFGSLVPAGSDAQMKGLASGMQASIAQMKAVWGAFWSGLAPYIKPIMANIKGVMAEVGPTFIAISGYIRTAWTAISPVVMPIVRALGSAIGAIFNAAFALIRAVMAVFRGDWQGAWTNIKQVFVSLWNGIVALLGGVWGSISALFAAWWKRMQSNATSGMAFIWNVIKKVWAQITAGIDLAIKVTVLLFTGQWGKLGAMASTAWNAVLKAVNSVWAGIKAGVTTGITAVVTFVLGFHSKVMGAFSGAGTWLLSIGRSIIDGILSGFKSAWKAAADWLAARAQAIKDLKGPLDADAVMLFGAGEAIIGGLGKGMASAWPGVSSQLSGFTAAVAGTDFSSGSGAGSRGTAGPGMGSVIIIADPRYTDMAKVRRDARALQRGDIGAGSIRAQLGMGS